MQEHGISRRICEVLVENGVVDEQTLDDAEIQAQSDGVPFEQYIVQSHIVSVADVTLALSEYTGIVPISLAHFTPSATLALDLGRDLLVGNHMLPLTRIGDILTLGVADPFNTLAIDEVKSRTHLDVQPLLAPEEEIDHLLAELFPEITDGAAASPETNHNIVELKSLRKEDEDIDDMTRQAEDDSVVAIVNEILLGAIRQGASDIHVEAADNGTRVRYRVNGGLVEQRGIPTTLHPAVISRLKILADCDIAERRLPQGGRFRISLQDREIDMRVSILPSIHGEGVVMRLLDKTSLSPSLNALGLDPYARQAMNQAIHQPNGIILVTGPTGSGKTTTLYTCLQELNHPDVKIITCEDPVEYQLDGICQVHINSRIGLTFAKCLREILRQDPDICLVGEIRDTETAEIAIRAALTGHLVLSTLHTNDAASSITRLIDMGIEQFLLSSSLILAQAQRLYRKLCPACKQKTHIPQEILSINEIDDDFFDKATVYRHRGCGRCHQSGYGERGALMEVLPVDDEIRELILSHANASAIRDKAVEKGMVTLKMAGLQKVREGITSLAKILEVTGSR